MRSIAYLLLPTVIIFLSTGAFAQDQQNQQSGFKEKEKILKEYFESNHSLPTGKENVFEVNGPTLDSLRTVNNESAPRLQRRAITFETAQSVQKTKVDNDSLSIICHSLLRVKNTALTPTKRVVLPDSTLLIVGH